MQEALRKPACNGLHACANQHLCKLCQVWVVCSFVEWPRSPALHNAMLPLMRGTSLVRIASRRAAAVAGPRLSSLRTFTFTSQQLQQRGMAAAASPSDHQASALVINAFGEPEQALSLGSLPVAAPQEGEVSVRFLLVSIMAHACMALDGTHAGTAAAAVGLDR